MCMCVQVPLGMCEDVSFVRAGVSCIVSWDVFSVFDLVVLVFRLMVVSLMSCSVVVQILRTLFLFLRLMITWGYLVYLVCTPTGQG